MNIAILLLSLKFASLILALAYSVSVICAIARGQAIGQLKMYLMAVPVGTFIFLQWIL